MCKSLETNAGSLDPSESGGVREIYVLLHLGRDVGAVTAVWVQLLAHVHSSANLPEYAG